MNYDFIMDLDDDEVCVPMKDMPRGYFITNKARVYAQGPGLGKKGRWLKPCKNSHPSGYRQLLFMRKKQYNIHRLVGKHFLDWFNDSLFVCHRDEHLPIPDVNYASNLYLGTDYH